MPRDLAISCEGMDCKPLLSEWRWLVPSDAIPLMIGIFGDWIFGAPDGSHWHLDLLEGQFQQVARDSTEFNARKREEKYRDEWFGANWADIALAKGFLPNADECLGWKIAPVLGGPFSVENMQVFSLIVYQRLNGQLFRQLSQK
ncbi:T6SS immunity protein Tdi1 domain-containing protein [Bradyrhizobium sp. LHD-71]|uniref:T6SS immunity protein Tdi1 domain-containing protein n=1 Tax=Bradyrhizobium sp. LHD-71 TaxID=3072141 RepID=UPI00280F66F7|nr:T6SS immunity protein Tdi1 domain-containing protein [Bradyrhizobium sp. LHD-71]MDQ8731944.1 DUF1851 domain-containing protein [Bradyrhizobium sp. LHD-71]